MITLPQSRLEATAIKGRMDKILRKVNCPQPVLAIAVQEDHAAEAGEEEHGLHWHILIAFGDGEKNRKRVSFKEIGAMFRKLQPECSCRCTTPKKGMFYKMLQDVVEYFLKQITVVTLGRQQCEGRYLTHDEFEEHRIGRFIGNWECCFALGLMGKEAPKAQVKEMKLNEKVALLANMMLGGKTAAEIYQEYEGNPDMQGLLIQKNQYLTEFVQRLKLANYSKLPEKKFPPCPIFKIWAPVAHADSLEEHAKKTHLVIYGPANTGKTSFVKAWCERVGARMCYAPRGGIQKFDEESFLLADVILLDDVVKPKDDNGDMDGNRINYSTMLNWANGSFIVSVFKKTYNCKPKILILTTNEDAEDIMPVNHPKYGGAIKARFHFWKTQVVDERKDPDKGNIFLHYCRKECIGPFAPAALSVPETPAPMQAIEDDDVIEVEPPAGCHGQGEIEEVGIIPPSDGEDEIPSFVELMESQEEAMKPMTMDEAYEFVELKAFWDDRGPSDRYVGKPTCKRIDATEVQEKLPIDALRRLREDVRQLKEKIRMQRVSQEY